jgi:hypothetical protein
VHLAVSDEYIGYCLDQAVGYFGTTVEYELEKAEDKVRSRKGKTRESAIKSARLRVLTAFGIKDAETKRFADPALMMK